MKIKEIKSFRCAIRGILHCIKNERHMRVHICVALYILFFSCFFDLSIEKYCILVLTISSVFVAEMVNTVAEELTDIYIEDYDPRAKTVKDIAAGVVLVAAIFSVIIGVLLFWDISKFIEIYNWFLIRPVSSIIFIFSILLSLFFIFFGPVGIKTSIRCLRFKIKK